MAFKTIEVRLVASIAGFQAQMGAASAHVRQLGTDLGRFAVTSESALRKLQPLGLAGLAAGAAIATGFGMATKAAIDFESAFAGVRKTVDGTEQQLGQLRTGILEMSKRMPATANEIAGVAEAAGQLGIQRGAILGFAKTMVDLGETTNLSADQAATSLARLANITRMPQTQFDRLGATVVALGNAGASTEAEIVEMGLRIAGAGQQIGLSEAEILSYANALSSVGIEAEAGGTAISRVMIEIAKAVKNGGAELISFSSVAGMSSTAFASAFEQDAAGAVVTFVEGLDRIAKSGGNVFGVLEQLELEDVRVRDALLRAAGAGDLFRKSIDMGSRAWRQNTALTNEASKRYETTAAQIEIARNNIVALGIQLGDTLLPAAKFVASTTKSMAEAFDSLPGPMKGVVVGGTAIVGMASLMGGGLLLLAPRIVATSAALKDLGVTMAGVRGAMGGVMGTGFLVGALAAVPFIALKAVGAMDDTRKKYREFANDISDAGDGLLDGMSRSVTGGLAKVDAALAAARQRVAAEQANMPGVQTGDRVRAEGQLAALQEARNRLLLRGNRELLAVEDQRLHAMTRMTSTTLTAAEQQRTALRMTAEEYEALSKAANEAGKAAAAAFGSDVSITNFDPDKGTLRHFFQDTLRGAAEFSRGIRDLIRRGLDPEVIQELLQAGPAAALPIMRRFLGDHSGALIEMANRTQGHLRRVNAEVVEAARLTAMAVAAPTDEMATKLDLAMRVAAEKAKQGASATMQSVAAALRVPTNEVVVAATQYGIQIANAVNRGIALVPVRQINAPQYSRADARVPVPRARGGIDPNITSSPTVLYGERGAEAYIPLDNDDRRPRAVGILKTVADMFGMVAERRMASGGLMLDHTPTAPKAPKPKKAPAESDASRLARTISTNRQDFLFEQMTSSEQIVELDRLLAKTRQFTDEWVALQRRRQQAQEEITRKTEEMASIERRAAEELNEDLIRLEEERLDNAKRVASNRDQFEMDRRPLEHQLQILNERLGAEETFSDAWMAIMNQREAVVDRLAQREEAAAAESKRAHEQQVQVFTSIHEAATAKLRSLKDEAVTTWTGIYTSAKQAMEATREQLVGRYAGAYTAAIETQREQGEKIKEQHKALNEALIERSRRTADEMAAMRRSFAEPVARAGDLLGAFGSQQVVSAAEISGFLGHRVEAAGRFYAGLQRLAASGIDPELLDAIAQAGPGALGLVTGLLQTLDSGGIGGVNAGLGQLRGIGGNVADLLAPRHGGRIAATVNEAVKLPVVDQARTLDELLASQVAKLREQDELEAAAEDWAKRMTTDLMPSFTSILEEHVQRHRDTRALQDEATAWAETQIASTMPTMTSLLAEQTKEYERQRQLQDAALVWAGQMASVSSQIAGLGGLGAAMPVAAYDSGGYLPVGWSMAYNGTGMPERVGGGVSLSMPITIDARGAAPGVGSEVRQAVEEGAKQVFGRFLQVVEHGKNG